MILPWRLTAAEDEKPPTPAQAYDLVKEASAFSMGGVGVTGAISKSEKGYRVILEQPDATAQFTQLLSEGTPAGKLYALLGLKEKDKAAYGEALATLEKSKDEVTVTAGCMFQKTNVGMAALQIAARKKD